jgi:hypothetical protein
MERSKVELVRRFLRRSQNALIPMASGNDKTSFTVDCAVRTVLVRYKLVHIIPADLAISGSVPPKKGTTLHISDDGRT